MKITLSWIKDFLETKASVQEIADQLSMLGLVVDDMHNPADDLKAFRVAHILETEQHPNADRLKVCKVDTGSETLQIVCGAPNARAGIKVVFAPIGTKIPSNGMLLKPAKIRDVESCGMMCSFSELDLGEDHAGIIELPEDAPVGMPYAEYAGLDDTIFEIEITPNRGDCLGAYGLARDLAATGIGTLKVPTFPVCEATDPCPTTVTIQDDVKDLCPLFTGRVIKGVKNGPSPAWMQQRLQSVGLRPISALVDITNYLSYAFGRPMHAYDLDKLNGDLVIRFAKDGEEILALNESSYKLSSTMLAVADQKVPCAIAGIIGGEDSGCDENTTNIFLESAVFDPISVTLTGRELNVITDSRYRFERSVDRDMVVKCLEETTKFILDHCGGEATEITVVGTPQEDMPEISFDPNRVRSLIGLDIDDAQIKSILTALGFEVEISKTPWSVQVPSWRHDITLEADLVEEVTRVYGYDHIPQLRLPALSEPNHFESYPGQTQRHKHLWAARRVCAARGLHESLTWSFLNESAAKLFGGGAEELKLVNPISSDLSDMRPSLLPNLMMAAQKNFDRGFPNTKVFEVGSQFKGISQKDQDTMVTGLRTGQHQGRHWDASETEVSLYDAKADALAVLEACGLNAKKVQIFEGAPSYYHPSRSGKICLGPKCVLATFGELHPKILAQMGVKERVVGFEVFVSNVPQARSSKIKPVTLSAFQPVERDFAFIVKQDIAAGSIVQAVQKADKELIQNVDVFDVYAGKGVDEGHKSVAISVMLQPTKETLSEEDLNTLSTKVVASVEKAVGGRLRS